MQLPDDDYGGDELLWVKAGEPGQKPTIIRQVRSESSNSSGSRDNSGGNGCQKRQLFTVENGTVYRNINKQSQDSVNILGKRTSTDDSNVIVVTVSGQMYPADVDKTRIRRWRELHSPTIQKKLLNHHNTTNINNNMTRPASQPSHLNSKCSPSFQRSASVGCSYRLHDIKSRDEGYTSLTEDYKDSDTESVRSKSLPSSWRPLKGDQKPIDLRQYAKHMITNNDENINSKIREGGLSSSQDCLTNKKSKFKKELSSRNRHRLENAIEICTCFVCLRSVVYHTQDEDDADSLVDHPCACNSPGKQCCGRWVMIGVMIVFMPFLICYPPLKLCLKLHDRRKKRRSALKEKRLKESRKELLSNSPKKQKL